MVLLALATFFAFRPRCPARDAVLRPSYGCRPLPAPRHVMVGSLSVQCLAAADGTDRRGGCSPEAHRVPALRASRHPATGEWISGGVSVRQAERTHLSIDSGEEPIKTGRTAQADHSCLMRSARALSWTPFVSAFE